MLQLANRKLTKDTALTWPTSILGCNYLLPSKCFGSLASAGMWKFLRSRRSQLIPLLPVHQPCCSLVAHSAYWGTNQQMQQLRFVSHRKPVTQNHPIHPLRLSAAIHYFSWNKNFAFQHWIIIISKRNMLFFGDLRWFTRRGITEFRVSEPYDWNT